VYSAAQYQTNPWPIRLPLIFAAIMTVISIASLPLHESYWTFFRLLRLFSYFLDIVSDIPQLRLLLNPENRDKKMMIWFCLLLGYHISFIPSWIYSWRTTVEPELACHVASLCVYVVAAIGMMMDRRGRIALGSSEQSPLLPG